MRHKEMSGRDQHAEDPRATPGVADRGAEEYGLQEALRQSEERFRVALEYSPGAVFEQDRELRFTWIHNAHPFFDPSDVLGKTDFELFRPEDAEVVTELKRSVLMSGAPARRAVQLTFAGEPHHYDLYVEPRFRDGEIIGVLCASWDITDRANEVALAASERRFRELADSLPQLVWTSNAAGQVDYYNARASEYDGLLPNFDWETMLHAEDRDTTRAAWRAAETEPEFVCEHRLRMADGSYRWHLSRARKVSEGGVAKWFGTATDIHDRKIAEERLREAVSIRDQLASLVSHDLRNPLVVIRMAVGALNKVIESVAKPEMLDRGETCLVRIDRQVAKMCHILDDLHDMVRLQTGQPLELERRPCDLVEMTRLVIEEQSLATSQHSIRLNADLPSLIGRWDSFRLERVMENLLSNAVKYSPGRCDVEVSVRREHDDAVVAVRDRGIGIADTDRERIFEWFTRGDNAGAIANGSGLGLAGARQIVEQHGGTLVVHSELGVGSTFIVRLPLGTAAAE